MHNRYIIPFIFGYLIGFSLFLVLKLRSSRDNHIKINKEYFKGYPRIYVGVLTTPQTWKTRGISILRTWGKYFGSDINFFMGKNGGNINSSLIINLNTLDVYPPQKKSFMMLKFMYDNFIDKYDWFIRADDDVYIFHDNLNDFLIKLDSSKTYYIGRQGFGLPHERDQLGLTKNGFCMGGTSIIISKMTLKKIGKHIFECLKLVVSSHEDTEIGRCVFKFANTTCINVKQVKKNFIHGKFRVKHFLNNKSMQKYMDIISLHPIRNYRNFIKLFQKEEKIAIYKDVINIDRLKKALYSISRKKLQNEHINREFTIINLGDERIKNTKLLYLFILLKLSKFIRNDINGIILNRLNLICNCSVRSSSLTGVYLSQDIEALRLDIIVHTISDNNSIPLTCREGIHYFKLETPIIDEWIVES
ncbi:hypothetical protein HZS_4980, partial [Henneguya salminicola]